nr:MAG TPA: hypothetical protein [Caudoviricetes sp.]
MLSTDRVKQQLFTLARLEQTIAIDNRRYIAWTSV